MTEAPAPEFIDRLDESVFTIPTALSTQDRISFLRVQQLVRCKVGRYSYLEIGSEQGASLQPHLLDPACMAAVSIDLRPPAQPDERARLFHYEDNSTARMLRTIAAQIGAEPLSKLTTFDADAAEVMATDLPHRIDLAMIDAEHTNVACFSDFLRVLTYVKPDAVISFHDANLILDAIQNAEQMLRYLGIPFETVWLPDCVAVIGLGGMAAPLIEQLAPFAHDRASYLTAAKKELQQWIAASMAEEAEIKRTEGDPTREEKETEAMKTEAYRAKASSQETRIAELESRLAATTQRADDLEQSISWKITKPLRSVGRLLRSQ